VPCRWALRRGLGLHLAYNAGRIVSYATAGAIAGALGEASMALSGQLPVRTILYLLANLMLIALGLYLMGMTRALAFSERLGQKLWRHLQPLSRRFSRRAARRRLFRSACCGAGCPAAWSTVPWRPP
jgi:sulfite exporter TauE/SafE